MDPDSNLDEQRRIRNRIMNGTDGINDANRLSELSEALDEWIKGGGFLPTSWRQPCDCVLRSKCCKRRS